VCAGESPIAQFDTDPAFGGTRRRRGQ
jgi:hypothetical protein